MTKKDKHTGAPVTLHGELLQKYGGDQLSPGELIQLELLASLLDELRTLQKFVNKHGTTYEVIGKSGDIYSKHRPEHQQLNEARQKVAQLARSIQGAGSSLTVSIDELLAG
jgi:hypothetical protein